ncbi:MAG: ATP-binding cassette domain-containing protein, partial [Verrucomicrobiota bacterium]
RCDFSDRIIEEERNTIRRLQVTDLGLRYGTRWTALDSISFQVERGEMVCVMGPSGCGKSTLLKVLSGQNRPQQGTVELNGRSLYSTLRGRLAPYISFIPHEEAIDPRLTVEENLDWAAAIRAPHLHESERKRKADAKLVELGLGEVRHRLTGDAVTKTLSGGQRKRLNAGLDMIGISDVYLFDEPTSGLSSKDSEQVLELIRSLSRSKIVLVSIHQPSARLFDMFDKALLLDHGGKLAFFGTPREMLTYFLRVQQEEGLREFVRPPEEEAFHAQPDLVFDVLETPLRDFNGEVLYEENERGQLVASRRFSPSFWSDRFQTHRLIKEIDAEEEPAGGQLPKPPRPPVRTPRQEGVHFLTHLRRAFHSRLRNRANLTTTLLEAPLLAALVALVLRYSDQENYTYASAIHIPTYLFLTLVIGMFLGLSNSAEEILRDRVLLRRERNHRVRVSSYVLSKFIALAAFAAIQCALYVAVGNGLLSIRSMFWIDFFWMYATTLVGVTIGLFVSSIVSSSKTALNVIPLILIPQIILGGALIKYEEMNRDLYAGTRRLSWWDRPPQAQEREIHHMEVPRICAVMPLRWAYEGMIVSHARLNPVSRLQQTFEKEQSRIISLESLSEKDEAKLDVVKRARPYILGMRGDSIWDLRQGMSSLRRALARGEFDPKALKGHSAEGQVSPESAFVNWKVKDLAMAAEMVRTDYRRDDHPNVFFGRERRFEVSLPGRTPVLMQINTMRLDALVLLLFALVGLVAIGISVRHRTSRT